MWVQLSHPTHLRTRSGPSDVGFTQTTDPTHLRTRSGLSDVGFTQTTDPTHLRTRSGPSNVGFTQTTHQTKIHVACSGPDLDLSFSTLSLALLLTDIVPSLACRFAQSLALCFPLIPPSLSRPLTARRVLYACKKAGMRSTGDELPPSTFGVQIEHMNCRIPHPTGNSHMYPTLMLKAIGGKAASSSCAVRRCDWSVVRVK
eukprot:1182514-Prorocentrum_minimum.AAC.3